MLVVFDHLSGRLELTAEGLEEGPRNPGHSGSAANAQAMDSDRMTLLMILLDYKFGGNVTDGSVFVDRFVQNRWTDRIPEGVIDLGYNRLDRKSVV